MINNELIFKNLLEDYKNARNSKATIDAEISKWNDLYYGRDKDNSNKKLLLKEVAKMIEYQKPNITEPFLASNNPIKVSRSGNMGSRTEVENYVNGVFSGDLNREELINDIADILLREGTVWSRTGWVRKTRMKTVTEIMTMAQLLELDKEPKQLNQIGQDLFEATFDKIVTVKNHPKSRICRNENIFPDPTARQESELNFVIEKRYVTYYDLVDMDVFSPAKLNELKGKILSSSGKGVYSHSVLEETRDSDNQAMGSDRSLVSDDINRRKVELMEYWGYYDLHNNGKKVPMVATWINDFEFLMELEENPMPSKEIPYRRAVYSSRPFSIWGNSLAFFLGESQNVKNGITRGMLDSLALANNGQKFVMRGAVDYLNFQRLKKKERYVMVNKPGAIEDGKYNQIPSSTFNLLDMVNRESSQLSGVDGSPAINGESLGKENSIQLTMAQQKMVSIVRSVSNLLARDAKEWLTMAEVFLDDEQIIELFSNDGNPDNDRMDINAFRESEKTSIVVNVGTSVSKQLELHNMNMLMQQSKALGETIPAEMINSLVAKMYDLFDMHEEANTLRNYKPQPSPEQQQMQQMEMMRAQLELAKIQKEIAKIESETVKNNATAQSSMIDSMAGAQYKNAQGAEKMARTESHKVDSALKPGEVAMKMQAERMNMLSGGEEPTTKRAKLKEAKE